MAKPRQTHAWKASHAPKKAPKKKGVNFSGSALPSDFCKRCGRQGHIKSECFAKKHKHGHRLEDSSSDEELGSTQVGIARIANMDHVAQLMDPAAMAHLRAAALATEMQD